MSKYFESWSGTKAENRWLRAFTIAALVAVSILSILLFSKEKTIVIQPYTLADEAWVIENNSSGNYKEAWGFALAQLIGNTTPSNVDFIEERLGRILSPKIYNDVVNILRIQAKQIKQDGITMRFEPRFVEYEPRENKVFVFGYSFTKGLSTKQEKRSERTYEFIINVSSYLPVVDYLTTYEGRPQTKKVLDRLQQREDSKKDK